MLAALAYMANERVGRLDGEARTAFRKELEGMTFDAPEDAELPEFDGVAPADSPDSIILTAPPGVGLAPSGIVGMDSVG